MRKGSLTNSQLAELNALVQVGKCDELKNICYGIELDDFQTLLAKWMLITRKFICTLDTGLGKTIIASAVMKYMRDNKITKRFVYVVENAGMAQTMMKIQQYTDLRVFTCTASIDDAYKLGYTKENFDVLMINYQALQSYGVSLYLLQHIDEFDTLIFDECQWLSEINNSNTWEIAKQMRKHFRDLFMFSATPFRTNPLQLLKQVEMLDSNILGNINEYIKDKVTRSVMYEITDWHGLDTIKSDLTLFVNGFSREELGIDIKYNAIANISEALPEQENIEAKDMTQIKGFSNAESMHNTINIVLEHIDDFEQGIIYCSTNVNKALLRDELIRNGVSVEIIDGTLSNKKERDIVQSRYLNGEISVLIINITTTLDLPSSYCIFYELCDAGTVTQFIGRCIRGLADSDLTVYFMLVADTYEIDYFYNSIYRKSVYLQKILGKDDRLMNAIKKQIDKEVP